MDPVTLILLSSGIQASGKLISALMHGGSASKARQQMATQLVKAYDLQNKNHLRNLNILNKNKELDAKETSDALANIKLTNALDESLSAEGIATQRFR